MDKRITSGAKSVIEQDAPVESPIHPTAATANTASTYSTGCVTRRDGSGGNRGTEISIRKRSDRKQNNKKPTTEVSSV